MIISRTIQIQDRIFSAEDIAAILTELSAFYVPADPNGRDRYSLRIEYAGGTANAVDGPPKDFNGFLSSPIRNLVLEIECKPNSRLKLNLRHGNGGLNTLEASSSQEDWVNRAVARFVSVLEKVRPQTVVSPYLMVLSPVIGWPVTRLMDYLYGMHSSLGFRLAMSLWFGFPFSLLIFSRLILPCFPSVELQTGPEHTWREHRKRKYLKWWSAVLIVGPSANFLYDVYKALALH